MMLESPVPRNWHAGFGGGHMQTYGSNTARRRVPTLLLQLAQDRVREPPGLSEPFRGSIIHF
jgi:hypothetical protein